MEIGWLYDLFTLASTERSERHETNKDEGRLAIQLLSYE